MIKLKQIEFKAHICIFRQILEEILVNLSPYFEVDYLLPRTLMACLTLERIVWHIMDIITMWFDVFI
jgi:hypothetical protein